MERIQYAASINRKELAAADPVVDIYNRRCGAIRSEKSRGSITVVTDTPEAEICDWVTEKKAQQ